MFHPEKKNKCEKKAAVAAAVRSARGGTNKTTNVLPGRLFPIIQFDWVIKKKIEADQNVGWS